MQESSKMLYIGYKFEINEAGLTFVDTDSVLEPDCLLKIENTPFKIGDTFVLTQKANDCMFFRRVDRRES
tara:strand:+ start:469 stop:678 length:210 start_codon:yes stop_codon:yes gene_type:complete